MQRLGLVQLLWLSGMALLSPENICTQVSWGLHDNVLMYFSTIIFGYAKIIPYFQLSLHFFLFFGGDFVAS